MKKMEDLSEFRHSYPELSEQGQLATQRIIDKFRDHLNKTFNEVIYEFTCTIADEITNDDSWIDVRQKTMDAMCGYPHRSEYRGLNWKQVRRRILEENRSEIINDIILDKESEIEALKKTIESIQECRRNGY
jgi:hypothetical protein